MLKKNYKLNAEDFLQVINNHELKENKYFLLMYQKNNINQCRAGVIVSSKISNLATERNLLKRQIKAILNQKLCLIPQKYNLVVIAKKFALDKDFKELEEALTELLVSLS
jgi:ribonuclease P protein component